MSDEVEIRTLCGAVYRYETGSPIVTATRAGFHVPQRPGTLVSSAPSHPLTFAAPGEPWSETISCGCTLGAQSSGRRTVKPSPKCREMDLHRAWAWAEIPRPPRWQYGWCPSRFEVWCMALAATFCAVYGPISVWGLPSDELLRALAPLLCSAAAGVCTYKIARQR